MQSLRNLHNEWFPVALVKEVNAKPISRRVLSTPILLMRDEEGVIHAYRDACPHRGYPLSKSTCTKKEIRCSYHGYRFNHQGECTEIPGLKGEACESLKGYSLTKYEVRESRELVFIRLEKEKEPNVSTPFVPDLIRGASSVGFDFGVIHCSYQNLIDNFMDSVHPAFVHPFLLSGKKKNAVKITVQSLDGSVEATYKLDGEVTKPGIFGALLSGKESKKPLHIERFHLPSIHQIDHQTSGSRFIATQYCVPVEENKTRVFFHLQILSPWPKWIIAPLVRLAVFFLIKQDQKILETLEGNLKDLPDFKPKSTVLDAIGLRVKQQMDEAYLDKIHVIRAPIEYKADL